jgi:hypothetical protein
MVDNPDATFDIRVSLDLLNGNRRREAVGLDG